MSQTNETTKSILADLYNRQIFAWRNSIGTGSGMYTDKEGNTKTRWFKMGKTGSGDIFVVYKGLHIELEIKTGLDRLRPEQIGHKMNLERASALYLIIKDFKDFSLQWNDLMKKLDSFIPPKY